MRELSVGPSSAITRRRFLETGAAVGGALATGSILAACGDDGNGGVDAPPALSGQELGDQLRELLGEPQALLDKGPGNFNIVGSFPLTGPGSIYGELQSTGFEFGAKHVEAWTNGKLKIQVDAVDNAGGDPEKAVANVRKAGLANMPTFLTSYIFGFGAQPKLIAQYKMLTLDPGGGTGPLAQGLPFCYGYRASFPQDLIPGLLRTIALDTDFSRVAFVDPEISADYNNANEQFARDAVAEVDAELVSYTLAPLGQQDYAATITEVGQSDPEVVIFLTFGTDVGYQAREIQRQALDVQPGGIDFTPDGAKIAGPAFEGWVFSHDYINTTDPPSEFSQLFVDEWANEFDESPENYNAAYYAGTFGFAIMMDRILQRDGDINDGRDWVRALEQDPVFPHVYAFPAGGGSREPFGEIILDKETHSPTSIPILGFRSQGSGTTDDIELLATYDIGARNFQEL